VITAKCLVSFYHSLQIRSNSPNAFIYSVILVDLFKTYIKQTIFNCYYFKQVPRVSECLIHFINMLVVTTSFRLQHLQFEKKIAKSNANYDKIERSKRLKLLKKPNRHMTFSLDSNSS